MKKILITFGTRPEAIKMAPLIKAFKENTYFDLRVCTTGQHKEMLEQVLSLFEIVPEYSLNCMKKNQDLYDLTANVLQGMKRVLSDFNPDIVFVHGDTSTAFASALASYYEQIPLAHIEAGLRTGDIYSPWPEEANRKFITQVCKYHFAPTSEARQNLLGENIKNKNVIVTGNTVIDALFLVLNKIHTSQSLSSDIVKRIATSGYKYTNNRKVILVTGHRRENHGQGLMNICQSLQKIAYFNANIDIVYPVHLNPNVQEPVNALLSDIDNIYLIKPLQYEEFVYLMEKSYFIITDSGGIQEEAPSLGKPVLVMRETTERPEALQHGTVKLVGTDEVKIFNEAQILLKDKKVYKKMSKVHHIFGDGNASNKVVDFIYNNLGDSNRNHYENS